MASQRRQKATSSAVNEPKIVSRARQQLTCRTQADTSSDYFKDVHFDVKNMSSELNQSLLVIFRNLGYTIGRVGGAGFELRPNFEWYGANIFVIVRFPVYELRIIEGEPATGPPSDVEIRCALPEPSARLVETRR